MSHRHALRFAPLVVGASPLARWDPRAKLLGLVPLIFVLAVSRTTAVAGADWCWRRRSPRSAPAVRFCLRRLALFGAFLVPFVLLLPVLSGGDEIWHWGPIPVYRRGLQFAGLVLLRAAGVILAALSLLHSAPLSDTLWAGQRLGVPRSLVQLALITLRYLPLLGEEYVAATTAAACRGWRPRADAHTYRTTGNLAAATLVRGHRRAEHVWQAMACRGFAGRLYPSRSWRLTFTDAATTIGCG